MTSAGGCHRREPVGGAAKGIPLNTETPSRYSELVPGTALLDVFTSKEAGAVPDEIAVAVTAARLAMSAAITEGR